MQQDLKRNIMRYWKVFSSYSFAQKVFLWWQVQYNQSFHEAYDSVLQGKHWGIVSIGANFTLDLMAR